MMTCPSRVIISIYLPFLIFYQTFLSPQVKQCVISTYKHGIYELPNELPNNLRLTTLGNKEIPGKCLNSPE